MPTPTIKSTILAERDIARRDGFADTLRVTQAMLTTISNAETAGKTRKELTDDEVIAVLRKLAIGYRDAASQFAAGGNTERAEAEQRDASIVESFLPDVLDAQATKDLVAGIVAGIVTEEGLTPPFSPAMNGRVMKHLKTRTDVDKKLAVSLVRDVVEAR